MSLENNGGQNEQNFVGTLKNFGLYSECDEEAPKDSAQTMARSD